MKRVATHFPLSPAGLRPPLRSRGASVPLLAPDSKEWLATAEKQKANLLPGSERKPELKAVSRIAV
jgi:hypothetical protein